MGNKEKSFVISILEEELSKVVDELDILNTTKHSSEEKCEALIVKRAQIIYSIDILEASEKMAMAYQYMFWSNRNQS
ncbi:hypothetical protein [Sporosarcina sp. FSL W7-1283]|uniref:hypothetical protein n=1 Tax=Sporosarcina sp. FSL W7-1283 TaxID=2921560 RepID=UPI0030FCB97B